jgi:hypothetical protein
LMFRHMIPLPFRKVRTGHCGTRSCSLPSAK